MKKFNINADALLGVAGVLLTVGSAVVKHITDEKSEAKKKEEWIQEAMDRLSKKD